MLLLSTLLPMSVVVFRPSLLVRIEVMTRALHTRGRDKRVNSAKRFRRVPPNGGLYDKRSKSKISAKVREIRSGKFTGGRFVVYMLTPRARLVFCNDSREKRKKKR